MTPHTLGYDNYCAGCGFSYPCEGAWRADAERLAAALRWADSWLSHFELKTDVPRAALAAHDALTGDKP